MRADFYLIQQERFREQPQLLVCKLVVKALMSQMSILILTKDMEQAKDLDDWLWGFDEEAFIPHQIIGSDDDAEVPVLIAPPGATAPSRQLIINLRQEPVTLACERILEIVPAEHDARTGSRKRWRYYKNLGYTLNKYDM